MRKIMYLVGVCLFTATFFAVLYRFYSQRIAAFGCFDDCFNYGAAFFLTKGKILYQDIFFNHQPLPAYISAIIQTVTKPINIYDLLLRHRQFVLLLGLIGNLFIIVRFQWAGILFMLLYEPTKWYLFGDRFLAEGMIVYPLVYITGLCVESLTPKKIGGKDLILTGIGTWFIIFSREPYIPLALFLFFVVLLKTKSKFLLVLLTLNVIVTVTLLPLPDYFQNVVAITKQTVFTDSLRQIPLPTRLIQMAMYPLQIIFSPHSHIFWQFIQSITIVFFITVLLQKKKLLTFFSLGTLFLANIRATTIDTVFYQGFQLLPWYGLLLFLTCYYLMKVQNKKLQLILLLAIAVLYVPFLFSPQSWLQEKISPHEELITNYSTEIQIGNAVRELSHPTDTLFLDGWAELIYWQANRESGYRYSWYTSVMPLIPTYVEAREKMFTTSPPDFYYGSCMNERNATRIMPEYVKQRYTNILSSGKPSCLWIKTEKVASISQQQWEKAEELLFEKP